MTHKHLKHYYLHPDSIKPMMLGIRNRRDAPRRECRCLLPTGLFASICSLVFGLLVVSSASAQFGQFGRGANEPYSGRIEVINRIKRQQTLSDRLRRDLPVYRVPGSGNATVATTITSVHLGPVISQIWQNARPELTKGFDQFLHERDIGGGFRTSRNNLTLAENGNLFVGWDGRGFTLKYVLRGNALRTSLRVPGPSPADSDPRFSINFDLEVIIDVNVAGNKLLISPARLTARAYRPDGVNWSGKLAVGGNNLIRFLGGPDFIGRGLGVLNSRQLVLTKPVDLELAKLNPMLTKATSDIAIIPGFDRAKNRITMTLVNAAGGDVR